MTWVSGPIRQLDVCFECQLRFRHPRAEKAEIRSPEPPTTRKKRIILHGVVPRSGPNSRVSATAICLKPTTTVTHIIFATVWLFSVSGSEEISTLALHDYILIGQYSHIYLYCGNNIQVCWLMLYAIMIPCRGIVVKFRA